MALTRLHYDKSKNSDKYFESFMSQRDLFVFFRKLISIAYKHCATVNVCFIILFLITNVYVLSNFEVNRLYLIFEAQKDMSLNDFLVCSGFCSLTIMLWFLIYL